MPILLFYITHPDEATAKKIGESMVRQKLAACANIFPMQSSYFWENEIQNENEWVSILKTVPELEIQLEMALKKEHPYQIPCIVRWEIRANLEYENWVRQETNFPITNFPIPQ